jgi:hypothetical protein
MQQLKDAIQSGEFRVKVPNPLQGDTTENTTTFAEFTFEGYPQMVVRVVRNGKKNSRIRKLGETTEYVIPTVLLKNKERLFDIKPAYSSDQLDTEIDRLNSEGNIS